jgi:hypothetical protein
MKQIGFLLSCKREWGIFWWHCNKWQVGICFPISIWSYVCNGAKWSHDKRPSHHRLRKVMFILFSQADVWLPSIHSLLTGDIFKDISSGVFYLASAMKRNNLITNIDRSIFWFTETIQRVTMIRGVLKKSPRQNLKRRLFIHLISHIWIRAVSGDLEY